MAFDQSTRGRLQKLVNSCRSLLSDEFSIQLQQTYGLDPKTGEVTPMARLTHLDDRQRHTAEVLRQTLAHYLGADVDDTDQRIALLDRMVREQAFTVLNRLAALLMMEARGQLIESVSKGYQSRGYQLYSKIAGTALGETGQAYQVYLFSVFDELAQELPALFDRYAANGLLFPRETALRALLDELNHFEIEPLWAADETIGWIYQYFNSKEERKAMRDASQAPRNSRELAVRNQFFTPRYVVEFLVDNTLGRLWFNATGGQTNLRDLCQFLLVKPDDQLHAAIKLRDPRTLKLLDPACGSMHFGLYAFDLFVEIYREAWAWEQKHGPGSLDVSTHPQAALMSLSQTYEDEAAFTRDVPRLIIENNIYGVDIDPRAAQIATLALWLRAQRAWHASSVKAKERPRIRRGQVVAAVAPPEERDLRDQFAANLDQRDAELFEKMLQLLKHLPELGVLLKVERELPSLISQIYVGKGKDLFAQQERESWLQAETRLRTALFEFSQTSKSTYKGGLFAQDALQGLRLIDLCSEVFDVVVMNPPFGDVSVGSKEYLFNTYGKYKADLYAMFVARGLQLLAPGGRLGAITSRTGFFLTSLKEWREIFLNDYPVGEFVDLGLGVLDSAMVEACCFVVSNSNDPQKATFINAIPAEDKSNYILNIVRDKKLKNVDLSTFSAIPEHPFAYWAHDDLRKLFLTKKSLLESGFRVRQGLGSSDNFRFLRAWWEVSSENVGFGKKWCNYAKGGGYMPFWGDHDLLVLWERDGLEIKQFSTQLYGSWSKQITNVNYYGRKGLTYSSRTSSEFSPRIYPVGGAFDTKGSCIFDESGFDSSSRLIKLLVIIQSRVFRSLVNMCVATSGDTARSYSEALIEKMPMPDLNNITNNDVAKIEDIIKLNISGEQFIETTHSFRLPKLIDIQLDDFLLKIKGDIAEANACYENTLDELDIFVSRAYGIDDNVYQNAVENPRHYFSIANDLPKTSEALIWEILSWSVGVGFGRYDWKLATCERSSPGDVEIFAPLPARSPGMIFEGLDSFHPHNGILVDDQGHPHDLPRIVEDFLNSVDISVPYEIRSWLQKDFFAFHLQRYSKSRRKAPIYWPLSTNTGTYTLWVYYPSMTNQTLFIAVNDFIDGPNGKLTQVSRECADLRIKGNGRSRDEEKQYETLQTFEQELTDLRNTLLKIAPKYHPKHDDGVQITAAPLWPLFRHKPWQKILKDTWTKLEKGDYDWAHLAMAYWPDRVREKCKTDKSLAIAHGLEVLYVEPEATPKKTRGKKKAGADE